MGNSREIFDVSDALNEISDLLEVMPFCGRKRKSSNVLPIQADPNIDSFIVLYVTPYCSLLIEALLLITIVSGLSQYSNIFS